jgi:hypothetical protein
MVLSDHPEFTARETALAEITQDIDLFGLRYIVNVNENARPVAFVALWLACSYRQSQNVGFLKPWIDTDSPSKLHIAAAIDGRASLVDVVKAAPVNS